MSDLAKIFVYIYWLDRFLITPLEGVIWFYLLKPPASLSSSVLPINTVLSE